MGFELPDLPYDFNALEPYISGKTLELHHAKYLQIYILNLNKLIDRTKFKDMDIETIIKIADGPVYNNAAHIWNHTFYFEGLRPGGNSHLQGRFADLIKNNFGTISFFKKSFVKAAESLFGAGWIWLVMNPAGSIEIVEKSNAGNPLRTGLIPLLNCDLWEHAYYLDYQNRRKDYLNAFLNLVDWEVVEKRYNDALLK